MCESIVRHQIANHSLDEILTNRNLLRDKMKKELQNQLTGWGIWLETVEFTNVRICSKTLFEDLQAEFRQEEHLKAEKVRMETTNTITERQLDADLKIKKSQADNETQKLISDNSQKLKRMDQEVRALKKQCEFEIQKAD